MLPICKFHSFGLLITGTRADNRLRVIGNLGYEANKGCTNSILEEEIHHLMNQAINKGISIEKLNYLSSIYVSAILFFVWFLYLHSDGRLI